MASALNMGPVARRFACLLALAAVVLGAHPAYLHAKATLAQALLQRAWSQRAPDGDTAPPWPGADTRPVARLQVPAHGVDQIVLAGDSGRTLAFGPGWAEASAAPAATAATTPDATGTTVISAHRDTHFAFLQHVTVGDALRLQGARGAPRAFRVVRTEVVDSRTQRIATDAPGERLLLVTCWPFDAATAGGPLRYVVTAVPHAQTPLSPTPLPGGRGA